MLIFITSAGCTCVALRQPIGAHSWTGSADMPNYDGSFSGLSSVFFLQSTNGACCFCLLVWNTSVCRRTRSLPCNQLKFPLFVWKCGEEFQWNSPTSSENPRRDNNNNFRRRQDSRTSGKCLSLWPWGTSLSPSESNLLIQKSSKFQGKATSAEISILNSNWHLSKNKNIHLRHLHDACWPPDL